MYVHTYRSSTARRFRHLARQRAALARKRHSYTVKYNCITQYEPRALVWFASNSSAPPFPPPAYHPNITQLSLSLSHLNRKCSSIKDVYTDSKTAPSSQTAADENLLTSAKVKGQLRAYDCGATGSSKIPNAPAPAGKITPRGAGAHW